MSEAKQGGGSGVEVRGRLSRPPFDRYGSYRLISDVLGRLREGSDPLRILDVGGEEGGLADFLPDDSVTSGLAEGDASEVPFEDGAFDYAISVDAYGRVKSGSREKYLSELRRTARRGVLLATAFDSGAVRGARRVADEFHRAVRDAGNTRLSELQDARLPELEDARRFFEGNGDTLSVLPNGYLPHWLAMTCLASYGPEAGGEMGGVLDSVSAFYNDFVYGSDNAEPSYRHLLVSLREPRGADLDGLVSTGPGPEHAPGSSALFGALAAVVPLAGEVKRLNAELAQREGAMARKEAQVDDLSRRLAELVTAEDMRWSGYLSGPLGMQENIEQLQQSRDELQGQLAAIRGSRAWRLLTVLHKIRLRISRSG